MKDYRIEYCAMIYILQLYDETENWEGILIDADFDYFLACEYLVDVLEDLARTAEFEDDEEGLEFYTTMLEKAINVCDNGMI